jgi:DUF2934 family protein
MTALHDRIVRRAYELVETRGKQHGQDCADWFQAERDIRDGSRLHAGLNSVAGNLLHHAIELALKGGLVRETSSEDLKKKSMRSLNPLWRGFKLSANNPQLDRPDRIVRREKAEQGYRLP